MDHSELDLNVLIFQGIWQASMDGGISPSSQYNTVQNNVDQRCSTFLYIGAHLTDGCGGAGAVWRLQ
jgi:hypothetical protein